MGVFDGFRALVAPVDVTPELSRTESETYDALSEQLFELMAERRASFTLTQALKLPPVIRAVQLLAGVAASFLPLAYRGNVALTVQPRITRKPDPFRSRYAFVYQTVREMVASRYGDAFWRLMDPDDRGYPRSAVVLPSSEVRVEWDSRRWGPRYFWRDQELRRDVEVKHIALDLAAGELRGKGPIYQALDYLYPVAAAEDWAATFFASGGLPETVLQSAVGLSAVEAAKLKAQWMDARSGPEPAVLSGGITAEFPGVDPQRSQLQEARAYGATVVARLLGIPAALLHVETSGATITYQNAAGALEELVKSTIAPVYLAPIEQAWSELVPAPQSVRFDLADLQRTDMAGRFNLYEGAITAGIMSAQEARALEGWGPLESDTGAHAFDPVEPVEPAAELTPQEATV